MKRSKPKTGYVSEKTCYRCEDYKDCPYKTSRIKGNNSKIPMEERSKYLEVSKIFQQKRMEDLVQIRSKI